MKIETGLLASLATIFAFVWQVGDSFTDKVSEEQLVEIKKLVQSQEHTNALLAKSDLTKRTLPADGTAPSLCTLQGETWQVNTDHINVKISPSLLWKETDDMDIISKGTEVVVLKSDSSGFWNIGRDWQKIEYCDQDNRKSGWVTSKTDTGEDTLRRKP